MIMMNYRDKKSKRLVAQIIVALICAAMVIGLFAGILGMGAM